MRYQRYEGKIAWLSGKFFCTEEEFKKFLTYLSLTGGTWEESKRREGGYYVIDQEEPYVLEFIALFENKNEI